MIDTHSHLLPGVDDGCKTLDESLACARALVAAGYEQAFCTPHVWTSLPHNTAISIPERVAELQRHFDAARVPLRLRPGGELNLRVNFTETPPDELVSYAMNRRFVLVDLWADKLPPHFDPSIRWLQSQGLQVILAHPERMRAVQTQPELADHFADLGVLLQGNLQCFNDPVTADTRRVADRYLSEGRYWMLGSDTHNPAGLPDRLAGLARVKSLLPPADFDRLTSVNPASLL